MISLIGIGNTGSRLVEKLSKYEQYSALTIDSGKEIREYKTPEEYEKKCPSFKKLFKNLEKEVYIFLSASGNISGALLRILEQLKDSNLNVVCVSSDPITLSSMGSLQQNLVVGVLQEYARSGMIENLYLIDNSKVEDIIGDVSLDEYWEKINETIAYIFDTFMYFKNTKSAMQFGDVENNIAKINTFAMLDEKNNKKTLYDFKYITNEIYFFSINKNAISLKEIKSFIQEQSENKKVGTYIYETTNLDEITYVLVSTSIPQTKKSEFGSLDK